MNVAGRPGGGGHMSMSAWSAIAVLTVVAGLTACTSTGDKVRSHADWQQEATRSFPGESKARLIAAAEAVLANADPRDMTFDYRVGGFSAKRRYFVYAGLAAADGEDRWSFSAGENEEEARSVVSMVDRLALRTVAGTGRGSLNLKMRGTFRLFYARMDYVLGRRKDWVTCAAAPQSLGLDAAEPGLAGLCGLTFQGEDAPPPASLPPLTPAGGKDKPAIVRDAPNRPLRTAAPSPIVLPDFDTVVAEPSVEF